MCLFLPFGTQAQKMKVESFKLDEKDLTAITAPNIVLDGNGEKCALIKIQTTQKGFAFDVGSLGVTDVKGQNDSHPAEIWLYVPHGVNWITLQHPQLGSIEKHQLGGRLKSGKTYKLKLTTDEVNTIVLNYDVRQNATVSLYPNEVEFMLNGMKQPYDGSGLLKLDSIPTGTHTYRVTAPLYHPADGNFTLTKEKPAELKIRLKQAFGYLTIPSGGVSTGATITVDGVEVGTVPLYQHPVASGRHNVGVKKRLYALHTETVNVADSQFVNIAPELAEDFAVVELLGPNDKETRFIIDGEETAGIKWKGKVEAGPRKISVIKTAHTPYDTILNLVKGEEMTVTLGAPTPIYGTLRVEATEKDATLIANGKPLGKTPFYSDQILIGQYKAKLVKDGCRDEEFEFEIKEGEESKHSINMESFCCKEITTSPVAAHVTIDNVYKQAMTPYRLDSLSGEHTLKLERRGYTTVEKKMTFDGRTTDRDLSFRLNMDLVRRKEFYLQIGSNAMDVMSPHIGVGFYAANFNMEGNFFWGFSKSEEIVWNSVPNSYGDMSLPFTATYQPWGWDARLGYGIRINSRLRITPQVGVHQTLLRESTSMVNVQTNGYYYDESYLQPGHGANVLSASVGARISVALTPILGLSFSPLYKIPVKKSDAYQALSDISSKIKGYGEGFGLDFNLNLYF